MKTAKDAESKIATIMEGTKEKDSEITHEDDNWETEKVSGLKNVNKNKVVNKAVKAADKKHEDPIWCPPSILIKPSESERN